MFIALFCLFALIFVTIVYFRLVRKIVKSRLWRIVLLLILIVLGASFVWAMRGRNYIQPNSGSYDLVTIGFYVMTVAAILCVCLIIRDLVLGCIRLGSALKRRQASEVASQPDAASQLSSAVSTRREFLMKATSFAALGCTVVSSPVAVWVAKSDRKVRSTELQFDKLPQAFDGFRIVHLSDIHVGNTISRANVEDIVRETNALKPDMIVITGDIADGKPQFVAQDLEPMRALKAPYGIFYVTGNHEHMWGGHAWCQAVADLGFVVLQNAHHLVQKDGAQIAVCGAIDFRGDRRDKTWKSDPALALKGLPDELFKLMLVHQPASVDLSFEHGADLVLLGHTHGGQFWPANYIVDAVHKYARGLYLMEQKAAFVSCGTGYWGPPLRIGVPPEICLHTLKCSGKSVYLG